MEYVMEFRAGQKWQSVMARFRTLDVARQFAALGLKGKEVRIHKVSLDADGVVLKDFGCVCSLPKS